MLATAYISALPANMEVTFDPDNGTADYTASSVIPLLQAHFEDRDTGMFGTAELNVLPKNIGLTFNTSGDVPEIDLRRGLAPRIDRPHLLREARAVWGSTA